MGFFGRAGDILTANINDMLDKMEDPEKMMKQMVREMEDAVAGSKGELVKTIAHEKRVEKEIASQKKKIEEWQSRAVEAVKQDRDDLARRALELKKESESILAALDPELAAARETSDAMKTQVRAIEAKCAEAKRKQATLSARQRTAVMQKGAAGVGRKPTAFGEFERIEDKVAQIEAEAEATMEVVSAEKVAEDEFARWESGTELDEELEELKKEVKGS